VLVVNRGEFVPVAGVVTTGSAKVNLLLLTRSANPIDVMVGDRVYPATFVMEGRLHVQVEKLRTTESA
jgi:Cu2+-exporting ATPase